MAVKSIVIIDRSRTLGVGLRTCLAEADVSTHVFSAFAPGLAILKTKKIDGVVVEFDVDKETRQFCDEVTRLGVSIIFTSVPFQPFDSRQYGFSVNFPGLPRTPSITIPYTASIE